MGPAIRLSFLGIASSLLVILLVSCAHRPPAAIFDQASQAKDVQERIRLYTRFLEGDLEEADRVVALNNRANAYREAGDLNRALEDYSDAIARYDRSAEIYRNRGDLFLMRGEFGRALADFDRAIALNPHEPRSYEHRGFALRKQGDWPAALLAYGASIEIEPNKPGAFLGRGIVYWEMNRLRAAETDFSKAISLAPDSVAAYTNRGGVLRQLGEFDGAMADFDRAITLAPENPSPRRNRAVLHVVIGNDGAAVSDYDVALRYDEGWVSRAYTVLLALLPAHRVGQDAGFRSHLEQLVVRSDDWPRPVLRYYRDEIDAAALIAAARSPDADTESGRLCEAYYYLGARAAMAADRKTAIDYFTKAVETGKTNFLEHLLAEKEKTRLGSVAVGPDRESLTDPS